MNQTTIHLLEKVVDRYYGKYRGFVTDNDDPKKLGRVRATVPEVLGEVATGWALPCVPYAGDGAGVYLVPEPGARVWVEFEAGRVDRPIWAGCWWGEGETPKNEKNKDATPPLKIIRTEKGLMVTMDDQGQTITLSDKSGSNMLTIRVQQGKITVKGAAKAVVEAPQTELVENATHPVVFGDQLLMYLNQLVQIYQTHTHPGELTLGIFPVTPAPPVPPLPPATPALVSKRVKTG